jgi:hypothetical protein
VAHERRLARAQVAVQFDESVGQRPVPGQALRKGTGVVLAAPGFDALVAL